MASFAGKWLQLFQAPDGDYRKNTDRQTDGQKRGQGFSIDSPQTVWATADGKWSRRSPSLLSFVHNLYPLTGREMFWQRAEIVVQQIINR